MSEISDLREIASRATKGVWKLWGMSVMADQDGTSDVGTAVEVACTFSRDERGKLRTFDADHIAAFDPPTVLALLDRLEAAEAAIERVRSRERGPMRRDQATDQPCRACPFAACGGCGYQTETSNETSREAL